MRPLLTIILFIIFTPSLRAKVVCNLDGCSIDPTLLIGEPVSINPTFLFYEKTRFKHFPPESSKGVYAPLNRVWNRVDSINIDRFGYGTYYLSVNLTSEASIGIKLPKLLSGSEIYFNGKLISRKGVVGESETTEQAGAGLHNLVISGHRGQNHLVVQLSNFTHYFGGGNGRILIGTPEGLATQNEQMRIQASIIIGAIVIMFFYHLYIWTLRKSFKSPLYFAIICFFIAGRSAAINKGDLLLVL